MRRLFIIRKDLHLSSGKLAAMVGHCAEAYWTRLLKNGDAGYRYKYYDAIEYFNVELDKEIFDQYINGAFVKTICQAKNLNNLKKAEKIATEELNLVKGIDFDYINDKCLTELTPENEDGTCTVGIWFKPLPDEDAHTISKKYHLYTD
jgi:peptidyl-tRNA hydrolase